MNYTKLVSICTGSKLYGTNTPSSDLDIKYIVLPDLGEVLSLRKISNMFQKTNNVPFVKNTKDDIDLEIIPFQTFARHFYEGQAYAVEIAHAIHGTHANQQFWQPDGSECTHVDSMVAALIDDLVVNFSNSSLTGMISYAVDQARLYGDRAKRMAACIAFKELLGAVPIADDQQLSAAYEHSPELLQSVVDLAAQHPGEIAVTTYFVSNNRPTEPCFKVVGKTIPWSTTKQHSLTVVQSSINRFGSRVRDAVNQIDWKSMSHAARIVGFVEELCETGRLTLPVSPSDRERILNIKAGTVDHEVLCASLDTAVTVVTERLNTGNTALKQKTHQLDVEFDSWLQTATKKLYNIG